MLPRNSFNKLLFQVLVSTIFLTWGCSTTDIYGSWKGNHVSHLLASWGPPNKKIPLKNGGVIYVYDHAPGETRTNYLGNRTGRTKSIGYYINKNGIIYQWKQRPAVKTLFK